jgi:hypothetical protein
LFESEFIFAKEAARSVGTSVGFLINALWSCPDFVDTQKDPNNTVREGGVHGRQETTVHTGV